jgi:hypothetical protein
LWFAVVVCGFDRGVLASGAGWCIHRENVSGPKRANVAAGDPSPTSNLKPEEVARFREAARVGSLAFKQRCGYSTNYSRRNIHSVAYTTKYE